MNVPEDARDDFERYCRGCAGAVPPQDSADWNRLAGAFLTYRAIRTFHKGTQSMRRDAQFSSIEKRVHRIHRWAAIGATFGSIIALALLGGGVYVVYLLLGHFGVI